jgi:hypothetical protein
MLAPEFFSQHHDENMSEESIHNLSEVRDRENDLYSLRTRVAGNEKRPFRRKLTPEASIFFRAATFESTKHIG